MFTFSGIPEADVTEPKANNFSNAIHALPSKHRVITKLKCLPDNQRLRQRNPKAFCKTKHWLVLPTKDVIERYPELAHQKVSVTWFRITPRMALLLFQEKSGEEWGWFSQRNGVLLTEL